MLHWDLLFGGLGEELEGPAVTGLANSLNSTPLLQPLSPAECIAVSQASTTRGVVGSAEELPAPVATAWASESRMSLQPALEALASESKPPPSSEITTTDLDSWMDQFLVANSTPDYYLEVETVARQQTTPPISSTVGSFSALLHDMSYPIPSTQAEENPLCTPTLSGTDNEMAMSQIDRVTSDALAGNTHELPIPADDTALGSASDTPTTVETTGSAGSNHGSTTSSQLNSASQAPAPNGPPHRQVSSTQLPVQRPIVRTCTHPLCPRSKETNGFTRVDNFNEHLRRVHGDNPPTQKRRKKSDYRA